MRKGIVRIVLGCVLILLQIMSIIGNPAGMKISISFANLYVFFYDVLFILGAYMVGIIGVILLVFGIRAFKNSGEENPQ